MLLAWLIRDSSFYLTFSVCLAKIQLEARGGYKSGRSLSFIRRRGENRQACRETGGQTALPEVEEDGQRDEQGGDGQRVTHDGHVEEDVGGLETAKHTSQISPSVRGYHGSVLNTSYWLLLL